MNRNSYKKKEKLKIKNVHQSLLHNVASEGILFILYLKFAKPKLKSLEKLRIRLNKCVHYCIVCGNIF
ncbi:hypothetical protein BpHYR1_053984 [Brachionus plicatilis]|uniref:Uncharacterized protein n=1 Tax=Brachionus plicatilis TaxID=10195 RepID=A0A3M7QX84_BRAPC|nr:hypothetical protein BpHYR1_053984 [Brachionus plicatilis]